MKLRIADWSIRLKMAALLLLASSLPMATTALLAVYQSRAALKHSMVETLGARADQLASELDLYHRAQFGVVTRISRLSTVADYLQNRSDAGLSERVRSVLTTYKSSNSDYFTVSILDLDGVVVASSDEQIVGIDASDRPFVRAMLEGKSVISDVFVSKPVPDSIALVAYAAPVLEGRNLVGGVLLAVHASTFGNTVRAANGRAGPGSFAVLFDAYGIRIAHSFNESHVFRPAGKLEASLVQRLISENRFGAQTADLLASPVEMPEEFEAATSAAPPTGVLRGYSTANGQMNLAVARRLHSVPWTAFTLVPEQALDQPISSLLGSMLAASFGLVLLSLVLGLLLAARLLDPVRRLSDASKAIARGELHVRLENGAQDELGLLIDSFNTMSEAVRTSTEQMEARVRERTVDLERANEELQAQKEELLAQREELRAQQRELELKNREVERANALKSEFLANMSHELRTPLNSVIGYTELLLEEAKDKLEPRQIEYLRDVLTSGRHLLELISDILDLSKIEAGHATLQLAELSPQLAIEEAVGQISPAARKKNLRVETVLGSERPVRADPSKLRQILLNLLSNAVKFAPEGSRIELAVDDLGALLRFRVRDEGPGVPESLLPRLFDPFVQGESPLVKFHQGTGLGLAISKRLVEIMGGAIEYERAAGRGAVFSFTLPIATPSGESAQRVRFLSQPIEGERLVGEVSELAPARDPSKPPTVMVIDDDPRVGALLRALLEPAGYRVVPVEDPLIGLELLKHTKPDLLIVDLLMPNMSGLELIEVLAKDEQTRSVPVLLLTGADVSHAQRAALKQRVAAVAEKGDISKDALIAAVDRATGRAPSPRPGELLGPTVLVVDDHDLNRELARAILERKGYRVVLAEGGEQALALARRERPALVLLDLAMPGLDGFQAARQFRSDRTLATIPLVALTALAMRGDEERAFQAGFDAFLTKPIVRSALEETVARILAGP